VTPSPVEPQSPAEPVQTPSVLVKGNATPEEVAALVAVLQGVASASAAAAASAEPLTRSVWAAPARGVRTPHHAGPGGWRASALPR
jgi:hypothetical protein